MWCSFLEAQGWGLNRPFMDLEKTSDAEILDFYTDAAKGESLRLGAVFGHRWLFAKWEQVYISRYNPSIEYLELLAVCMAVFTWTETLRNKWVVLFCDNQAAISMIKDTTARCKNCMVLIRLLTLRSLEANMRTFSHWVRGSSNIRADWLSRQRIQQFKDLMKQQEKQIDQYPTNPPTELCPASKLWIF